MCAAPEVCGDYDGNIDLADEEDEAGKGSQAKVKQAVSEAIARQRAWLKRGRQEKAKWKPTTYYRKSAKRWLECLDNQASIDVRCQWDSGRRAPLL